MKKKNVFLIAVLMLSMLFIACGKPKTVEDIFNKPMVKQALDKQKENELKNNPELSDVQISVSGNELEFDFFYAEGIELKPSMFDTDDSTAKQVEKMKDDFENDTGIRPETIVFKFYNSKLQMIKKLSF